ncbi:hypothetical protein D3C84_1236600 [compost metagenome]
MGPGARQLIELQAAVENTQVVRADKLHREIGIDPQRLAQHLIHRRQHRLLARGRRQQLHVQRLVVEGHDEPRTAHAA